MSRGRWLQWVVVAVPTAVLVALAWHTRWMSDDGFIHLRVVEQVLAGNGPVFNAGERVEASTSPLWVALLVVADPIPGLALPWKAVLLGIAFSAVGLLAAQRAAIELALPRLPRSATPGGAAGPDGRAAVAQGTAVSDGGAELARGPGVRDRAAAVVQGAGVADGGAPGPDGGAPVAWGAAVADGRAAVAQDGGAAVAQGSGVRDGRAAVAQGSGVRDGRAAVAQGAAVSDGGAELAWGAGVRDGGAVVRGEAVQGGRGTALGRGAGLVLPVGAWAVVALRPFWEFSTSGLETGLVFAWLGLSMWWCARRVSVADAPRRWVEAVGAALVGLGWLIRPDLVVFSLTFGTVLLAAASNWRRRAGIVAAMGALPLAYQLFRMGYYAMVVPNTALAKEATQPQWAQGWRYLRDLVDPYALWIPLALLVTIAASQIGTDLRHHERLHAAARLAPAIGALLHGAYVMRAGGDFMHGRLLLPAAFGLMAPLGVRVTPTLRQIPALATATAVLVWALVCGTSLRRDVHITMPDGLEVPISADGIIMDERAFYVATWDIDPPVRPDLRFTADQPEPGLAILSAPGRDRVAVPLPPGFGLPAAHGAEAVGMPSYAWGPDVYVMDAGSLGSPVGSHVDGLRGTRPGHQKVIPLVWTMADLGLTEGGDLVDQTELDAARRALDCGRLQSYLDDIRSPLTVGGFLGNIADSIGNTRFRIDRDPIVAEAQMCD